MNKTKYCPNCGDVLLGEVPGELCGRCVMQMGLSPDTFDTMGAGTVVEPPLSPEEMSGRFPQFKIMECLGRGGMGVVYKARQKALDRIVAIKLLVGERQGDVEFAERFEREAKILAQMSHPNIVTVHDFGEVDGFYYIVMEYVDGVNLRDLLREEKMESKQALAVVPPICEALEYAHDKGVVHRDIKPENLLLDREGRVKIADFGIASLVGATGENSGTPPYMAPEQSGGSVDQRADIYALGVVLYEMLTGERPAKDVVAPSRKVEMDVRIDEMVLRALEKEPEKRYQTAGEFQTMVKTVAGVPEPEVASPTDEDEREGKSTNWKKLGGLLLLVVLVVAWVLVTDHKSESRISWMKFPVILLAAFAGVCGLIWKFGWKATRERKDMVSDDSTSRLARWMMIAALPGSVLLLALVPGGRHHYVLLFGGACALTSMLLAFASWGTKLGRALSLGWLFFIMVVGVVPLILWLSYAFVVTAEREDGHVETHWPVSIQTGGLSAYAVQGAKEVEFMFLYDGKFKNTSSRGGSNAVTSKWTDEGSILLANGRSFGFRRESLYPRILNVNGVDYDLQKGRLFVIEDDGFYQKDVVLEPVSSENMTKMKNLLDRLKHQDGIKKDAELIKETATAFMTAFRDSNVEGMKALAFLQDEMTEYEEKRLLAFCQEVRRVYQHDLKQLLSFPEVYRKGGYAVIRVAEPSHAVKRENLYLILGLDVVKKEWRVLDMDDIQPDQKLSDRLERYLQGQRGKRIPETGAKPNEENKKIDDKLAEGVAKAFMSAMWGGDIKEMQEVMIEQKEPNRVKGAQLLRDSKEVGHAYRHDPKRLMSFTEWYREGEYAVARVAEPLHAERKGSLYLILGRKGDPGQGEWRILKVNDIRPEQELAEMLRRYLGG